MKVSIKTVLFHPSENVDRKWQWGLTVKAGGKHDPTYQIKLHGLTSHRTSKEAIRRMRLADQSVRHKFRVSGKTLPARDLRAWWRKWARETAT